MLDTKRRHFSPAKLSCRGNAAVAGDDQVVFIDQHRVHEAEALDRGGDLLDLPPGMGPGVARMGLQSGNRDHLRAGQPGCALGGDILSRTVHA